MSKVILQEAEPQTFTLLSKPNILEGTFDYILKYQALTGSKQECECLLSVKYAVMNNRKSTNKM